MSLYLLISRLRVITIPRGDLVTLACVDADFPKRAVPILIRGAVSRAVLVMKFVGDLFKSGLHFFKAFDFDDPAAGLDSEPSNTFFVLILKDVQNVAIIPLAALRRMLHFQHVCDDVILLERLQRVS